MNRPQSLNIFLFPSAETKELGSVETPQLLRILRPVSFGLWLVLLCIQAVTVISTGETSGMLLMALSTILFAGVHLQYWYEDSEHGRKFHHTVERMRGRIYEDDATGLPNGRHFVFELRRQMMRAVRNGRGFSLVLTDLAGWENVKKNERETLLQASRALRQAMGDGDFLARLQGAIFATVLLDDPDRSAAEKADGFVGALGSAIPLDLARVVTPIVSITGYQGELEVRDYLRRAQRDLQEARARGTGPLSRDPERVLKIAS